mmetsp:Transcript_18840/g.46767  ORF Transcript_18840/g.46767 Transcript_18840/m.46767 type:complete len:202 (+) Transcript_18840:389-994(+)
MAISSRFCWSEKVVVVAAWMLLTTGSFRIVWLSDFRIRLFLLFLLSMFLAERFRYRLSMECKRTEAFCLTLGLSNISVHVPRCLSHSRNRPLCCRSIISTNRSTISLWIFASSLLTLLFMVLSLSSKSERIRSRQRTFPGFSIDEVPCRKTTSFEPGHSTILTVSLSIPCSMCFLVLIQWLWLVILMLPVSVMGSNSMGIP